MSATTEELSVRLTAHPLQRVGAFALAVLAHRGTVRLRQVVHPHELTDADLRSANARMTVDLEATCKLADAKEPNGFWLKSSRLFWPNSPLNTTNRAKLTRAQRGELLHTWRDLPEPEPQVPAQCMLCDRNACGFYGKRDVPLLERAGNYNNTPAAHPGMALCRACLLSFYAMPYGCARSGPYAVAAHTWNDDLLLAMTKFQVDLTNQLALAGAPSEARRSRELTALQQLRKHGRQVHDGMQLLIFTNDNRGQELYTHEMEQPVTEWARSQPRRRMRTLGHVHRRPKKPGREALARTLFEDPDRLVSTATHYLRDRVIKQRPWWDQATELAEICFSYAQKVLKVTTTDLDAIDRLAYRIAHKLNTDSSQQLRSFDAAWRKPGTLAHWLRRAALDHTLRGAGAAQAEEPFITEQQWLLLFDDGEQVFRHRDLLLVGVLRHLHEANPTWLGRDQGEPDGAEETGPDDDMDAEN